MNKPILLVAGATLGLGAVAGPALAAGTAPQASTPQPAAVSADPGPALFGSCAPAAKGGKALGQATLQGTTTAGGYLLTGTVVLTSAPPGTYKVFVGSTAKGSTCQANSGPATLTVDKKGHGQANIQVKEKAAGTYFVYLNDKNPLGTNLSSRSITTH